MHKPYYKYEDFRKACGENMDSVIPIGRTLDDAKKLFSLYPKSVLLSFIYNNGLEKLEYLNTKEWEKNQDKKNPLMVDAYEFKTNYKTGYIAFMYNEMTLKWIIKSFHLSLSSGPSAFQIAFQKKGLLPGGK
jgi:hypothetical protein